MTPQQIDAMKLALEALETELSIDWTNNDEFNASAEKMYEAITAIKEALAEHAMQEVQRLGQEIEQKPVAWLYEARYSSGSYSGCFYEWRVTTTKNDTKAARNVIPLIKGSL